MLIANRTHRCTLWLLIAAVVLSAVLQAGWMRKAISAKAGNANVVEVCTGAGVVWVDLTTGAVQNAPEGSGHGQSLDHCPCCTGHAAALPTAPAATHVLASNLSHVLPFLYWHAPRPLFAWTHANPRAPPTRA